MAHLLKRQKALSMKWPVMFFFPPQSPSLYSVCFEKESVAMQYQLCEGIIN